MLKKIKSVREVVVDFCLYLEASSNKAQNLEANLLEVIKKNAIEMIKKLDKLTKLVPDHSKNNPLVDRLAQEKLIEYIQRVQEAIQNCLYREQLKYKVATINWIHTSKTTKNLEKCNLLEQLSYRLSNLILLSPDQAMRPKKSWLNNEWVKVDSILRMQLVLNERPNSNVNDRLFDLAKTVLFSEKNRLSIMNTTRTTLKATDMNGQFSKVVDASYQNSMAALDRVLIPKPKL